MLSKHNGFDTQTQAVNPYYIHLRSNIKSLLGNDVHKQKPRVRRRELTVDWRFTQDGWQQLDVWSLGLESIEKR